MRYPRPLALLVLAAAAATVTAPTVFAQRELRERHAFVTVTGANDAPVVDLTAGDFAVREDGVAREVLRVAPADPPSHVALVVDNSAAIDPVVSELRNALASFVRKMAAGDGGPHVGVTTFGDRPTVVAPFAPGAAAAEHAIGRIFSRPGSGAYLMDAILGACRDLKKGGAARPVVVAFVDEDGAEFSSATHQMVADALRETGASLWTVVLAGTSQSFDSNEARERAQVLGTTTADSGGYSRTVLARQGLESAFQSMAALIGAQYDVVYGRPESLIPPKRLEVTVSRRDLHVLAPHWPRP
jgi:von Willebrand factor type A domain